MIVVVCDVVSSATVQDNAYHNKSCHPTLANLAFEAVLLLFFYQYISRSIKTGGFLDLLVENLMASLAIISLHRKFIFRLGLVLCLYDSK